MRILSAGDIHGDVSAISQLVKQATSENVDLVVLCGDLTGPDGSVDNIIGPFKKANKKVLFIPGNHDTFATADFLAELYGVKNLHGYSAKYENVGFFGCGGANVGLEALSEAEILSLLKQGHDKIADLAKKIMVTHVHPSGSKMQKFSDFVPPSSGVRMALDSLKPDVLLCAHVHEAHGLEETIGKTRVFNVGKKGRIIDL